MHGKGIVTRRTNLILAFGVSLTIVGRATVAAADEPLPPPPAPPQAQPPPPVPVAAPPQAQPVSPVPSPPIVDPQSPSMPPAAQVPPGYPPAMLIGPSRLPYVEGETIPQGYSIRTRPRMKMALAGIATFAPIYGLSVLFAGTYLGNESRAAQEYAPLLIPVVGPFATIGTAGTEESGTFFLAFIGLSQATGAALFVAGLAAEEKYLARTAMTFDPRPEVFVGPRSLALRWQF